MSCFRTQHSAFGKSIEPVTNQSQVLHSTIEPPCSKRVEPWHGISNNHVCATSKVSDQPAHTGSLIRAFASCLNIL